MANARRTMRSRRPGDAQAITVPDILPQAGTGDRADRLREFIFKLTLVVLAGLWIYSPTYHGDWLWDDDQLLTNNLTVQHRVSPDPRAPENSLATLVKLWTSPEGADYFPLSYTSLWMQWPFFSVAVPQPNGIVAKVAWPTGYHVVTILLHIAAALAFWWLLHVMKLPGAWLGGMLFAIHPVCVESVAWVSEIKNTLSQPLFLLACASFVQFDDDTDSAKATKHYLWAVLFYLFAMFAKTAVVTFPFVILLYGWWKHGFAFNRHGVRTLLLVGASLALTVVPEMYWLVELRNGRSSWLLYSRTAAIALMGPMSSLALAAWSLNRSGAESASRGKSRETYLSYALVVQAILLVVASLVIVSVPESYWPAIVDLVQKSWPYLWPVYLLVLAIALLVPLGSLTLAASSLKTSAAERESGTRAFERYVSLSLPFFWISVVLGIATCYFQWSRAIGQEAIPVGGLLSRIATAGMGTLFYLWTTIWPFNLLTIYPRWEVDPPKVWQFLPWPVMIAAGWWLFRHRGTAERPTWQRHMIFVLAFFVLMLLPIIGIITISYMRITWVADHFLYTPLLGVLGIAAAGVAGWYAKLRSNEQPAALVAGAVLLAVLGYSSFRYAHVWANEEALWPHTIAGHPNPCHQGCGCWQAHNRLGAKKFARGDLDAAHYHFQNSTRLRPDLGETHNNLGTTLSARAQRFAQQGNPEAAKREMDAAIEQFAEAVRVTPHVPAIQVNLANALAAAGRFGEAGDRYKLLLEKEPDNPLLLNNYGVSLYKQGLTDASIKQFRRALEIAPDLKDAKESLAVALGEKPDPSKVQPSVSNSPPPGGRLILEAPISPTLNAAPAIP